VIQIAYNKKHSITPQSIKKVINQGIEQYSQAQELTRDVTGQSDEQGAFLGLISDMEKEMELAARNLMFEKAAALRDKIKELKSYETFKQKRS
jgi:excinuclease ABC subunit B